MKEGYWNNHINHEKNLEFTTIVVYIIGTYKEISQVVDSLKKEFGMKDLEKQIFVSVCILST